MIKFIPVSDKLTKVFGLPLKIELAARQDGNVVGWFVDRHQDKWGRVWGSFGTFPSMSIAKAIIYNEAIRSGTLPTPS